MTRFCRRRQLLAWLFKIFKVARAVIVNFVEDVVSVSTVILRLLKKFEHKGYFKRRHIKSCTQKKTCCTPRQGDNTARNLGEALAK